MARSRTALFLLIAAALLLAPSLMLGTMMSHSSPQNLTWAGQFAEQFRAGILYPRFLAESFDRMGGPAFYFYPPIAFWLDALLSVVTFDAFSVSYRQSLSSLLLLWASGLAMYAWLDAKEVSPPRAALYGALAYMVAPYHLVDHYYRGAYAEFAAYAVFPIVMLAVRQIAEQRRFAPILLAVSYAALPMTHLPTALLISLTALPLYVLYRGWLTGATRPASAFFLRCALGGALGLGLAAIYLVPALTLQDWIPVEDFWAGGYRIENWLLIPIARQGGLIEMMLVIASASAAYAIAAAGVLATLAWRGPRQAWRSEAACWAVICLLSVALVAGLVPWFWRVPLVAKVQFSWRLMIVVEFAAISALCLAPWSTQRRALSYVLMLAMIALVPGLAEMATAIRTRIALAQTEREEPADLKQFLPAGYPQKPDGGYAELSLEPVHGLPTIACTPQPRLCRADNERFGAMRVEIAGDAPTTVVLRRFFFPFWRLDPALPLAPTQPLQLVSFTAPAGHHSWHLERVTVPAEKKGWAISGLSLALLLAWALILRRRQRAQ